MGPGPDHSFLSTASAVHHGLMVAIAAVLSAVSFHQIGWIVLPAVLAGWSVHSLIAYGIHRFWFHGRRGPLARAHAQHHASPLEEQLDLVSYFGPMGLIFALWLLVALVIGSSAAAHGAAAGACLSYSWFRLVHRLVHWPKRPGFIERYVAVHDRHHSEMTVNFSVTFPFWDRVFGTSAPLAPNPEAAESRRLG